MKCFSKIPLHWGVSMLQKNALLSHSIWAICSSAVCRWQGLEVNLALRKKAFRLCIAFLMAWVIQGTLLSVKATMLKSLRIDAGLGNPLITLMMCNVTIMWLSNRQTTVLKSCYSSLNQWRMIANQKKDIEWAVVGMGEYQLASNFSALQVDTRKVFKRQKNRRTRQLEQGSKQHFLVKISKWWSHEKQGTKHNGRDLWSHS